MNLTKLNILRILIDKLHDILSERQFLMFSSVLIGILSGLAAVFLKSFVFFIRHLLMDYDLGAAKYIYLILPIIGIGIVIFVIKPLLKQEVNAGSVTILHSIAKKGSFLPFEHIYSYIITSGLTVGFGGSAGLESPIVNTGSAIGSNFGRLNNLSYKERTLLLAAGVAGGIAGAFNAPIAGVLFALEVILIDITITAFIPLLIASVSGALISTIILKEDILLSFRTVRGFDYHNVPFYIALGIIAGVVSIYYVNTFHKIENVFEKLRKRKLAWLTGSLLLVSLLFVFPALFGEGYDTIKKLDEGSAFSLFKQSPLYSLAFSDWGLMVLLGGIMFVKVIAASLTIGAGGVGGNFAPSLFTGAYLGYVFARLFQLCGINLPLGNFMLVAMAGVLSGVFHAPLTGIFLIAEISGGYGLIIPLMIVASFSFLIVKFFHPESMEIKKLKKVGAFISEDKDVSILGRIEIKELIEDGFVTLCPEDSLGKIIEYVKHSKQSIFPVVNRKQKLLGTIELDNIRQDMFNPLLYDKVMVRDILEKASIKITMNENIFSIMKKFDESGKWELPVVDKHGEYRGFLSKSAILSKYRNELIVSFN